MTRKLVFETKEHVGASAPGATYQLYETAGAFREIYIDGMQGVSVVGPIVKINCYTRGAKAPANPGEVEEREVACRLVMGTDTFLAIVDWLKLVDADLRPKIDPKSMPRS